MRIYLLHLSQFISHMKKWTKYISESKCLQIHVKGIYLHSNIQSNI